jgi:hypothetical protein
MTVVGAIPPGKVDWGFRPDKFTLGDLVRLGKRFDRLSMQPLGERDDFVVR